MTCCNNLAACHAKWGQHSSVVQLSSRVLQARPDAVKALYRRGVARLGLGDCDTAERDLVAAHKLDPANRAVSEKLGLVQHRRKLHRADMAKKLSKVLS